MPRKQTVAVIGAGPSGLSVLRYLAACPSVGKLVAFERYGEVGGLWVYTDRVGTDVDGLPVHSCIYKDLRTNFPKALMTFPDFPFPKPRPSFPGHEEVKEYLQAYADRFHLKHYIKFHTIVMKVDPLSPGSRNTRWNVTYCSPGIPEKAITEEFEAVIVCNGHASVPFEPEILGREKFRGTVMHSRDFRSVDSLRGKTVVLLGAGISAADIAPLLNLTAKKVIISQAESDTALPFQIPANASRKPLIHHLTETSAVFDNGEEDRVDAIILCTGYRYSFPFLTDTCGVVLRDQDRRVTPLYKHMIHTTHPSLMFVGIPDYCVIFTVIDRQAMFIAKVFDGAVALPNKKQMDQDTDREFQVRITEAGINSRTFHKLMLCFVEYCDSLAEMAKTSRFPRNQRSLFEYIAGVAFPTKSLTFKTVEYELTEDSFRVIKKASL